MTSRASRSMWLVEAVEEDERVRSFVHQAPRHVAEAGEVGRELHRHGDRDRTLHVAEDFHVTLLDRFARDEGAGRDEVDVEFERVGARLFDEARVLDPAAGRDAVEAADDGDVHRGLGRVDEFEVARGANAVVARHLGEVGERLGRRVGAVVERGVEREAFEVDLLLEERVHHDGRGARVLQPADAVQSLRERRRRRDEGVLQP